MTHRLLRTTLAAALAATLSTALVPTQAQTSLADQPVFSSVSVPGNLALTLSVEFPTAVSNAHIDAYSSSTTFLGYFDPLKCYDYVYSVTETDRYFQPAGTTTTRTCGGTKWSGNYLNWATMQTIDPFRWALTGGYRTTDTATTTIIEKAYATGQGGTGNFPDRSITTTTLATGATPLGWGRVNTRVQGLGNKLRFTRNGDNNASGTPVPFGSTAAPYSDALVWEVSVRVKVCDNSTAAGGAESNCKQYGSNWKPEGLIQKYSDQIRYSAFGYLNDSSISRDGAVLRARQTFVGPTMPVPGSTNVDNPRKEWLAADGTMKLNPDADDASASSAFGTISNSGVMNYLNKFGQITPGSYKTYDPVGELYYTAMRYYRNVGNVSTYTSAGSGNASTKATYADGFPVITDWDDPILYSCQKNYILGIGDVNTHADRNLPGTTGGNEPSQPAAVSSDYTPQKFDPVFWTNKVGSISGINSSLGTVQNYNGCCNNNGALMAGMAYWANTQDIRPDDATKPQTLGTQNVQTYWLDVLEYQTYKANNQFYLAAKYGGFVVPSGFDSMTRTTDIDQAWWHTGGSSDVVGSQLRPDTYYTSAKADQMVNGLSAAFASIASRMKAYTASYFSDVDWISVSNATGSYATQYDAKGWTGEVIANSTTVAATLNPDGTGAILEGGTWLFSNKLATQAAGTGWDTGRYIVTYNPSSASGVPFRIGNLTSDQSAALDTSYRTTADSADYLNYLRGDTTNEQNSTITTGAKAYRARASLVGDIVNSQVTVIGPPSVELSEAANPGYAAFKTANSTRPTTLVVGTNAGMVHVINGSLTGTDAGKELFAFIPNAVYKGPNNTPNVDGLASVGNPTFSHHYMVDARPAYANVDFGRTVGSSGTNWRTIVVGGLGKGGRSVYALDVTSATSVNSETTAASRVLWEFTDTNLGFTFGEPIITRTAQYGWVVIFGSGYNNNDGHGYFYILNARTGALLQKVALPTAGGTGTTDDGTVSSPIGMAHLMTYYRDTTDTLVESVYAGDLKGNLWRLDLTSASGSYPAPIKIAKLTDPSGNAQPVTSAPMPIVQPGTLRRWITVGTGRLLHSTDINSSQVQRFYAIIDGTQGSFATTSSLPASVSFPITASNLQQVTDTTQSITMDYTTRLGWYLNLGSSTAGVGYRVLADPAGYDGTVGFAATVPSSADACSPSGTSRVYWLDLGTGNTQFYTNAAYLTSTTSVNQVKFVNKIDGDPDETGVGLAFSGDGEASGAWAKRKRGTGSGTRLINWREVPMQN